MAHEIITRVVDCLATTTRYPAQLLTPEADLENDLGIDSVKLVEIVIALSEEFNVELHNEERDPSIRTIEQLASWIEGFLDQPEVATNGSPAATHVGEAHVGEAHLNGASANGSLTPEVESIAPQHAPPVQPQDQPQDQPRRQPQRQPQSRQTTPSNGHHRADANHGSVPPPAGLHHFTNGAATQNGVHSEPSQGKSLSGRVALVTGSGRGVGRTVARVLAERGATVLVNSFHSRDLGEQTVAEIKEAGGKAFPIWGSVANPEHVDKMFAEIEAEYGLDILVCNASDGRIGSFLELTPDDWDRAFRTNVSGHYQCAVRAARIMQPRGGGSIVTMSAVGAHQFIDGLGSQGVVKAAVETLTRYLACELGRFGIRVNCVAGGPVYGDLLSQFPAARATQNFWESIVPDGELCTPLDLAKTIAFLVSEEARGVNGAVWMVDHGFSANADGQPLHHAAGQRVRVTS